MYRNVDHEGSRFQLKTSSASVLKLFFMRHFPVVFLIGDVFVTVIVLAPTIPTPWFRTFKSPDQGTSESVRKAQW